MAAFRLMSYHLNRARNAAGEQVAELSAAVIRAEAPDLVMLQQIGAPLSRGSLTGYAEATGLTAYGPDLEGSCAFLSRHPLVHLQNLALVHGGQCVRADLERPDERIHLFNLSLSPEPWQRREQIKLLLSEQLLNHPSLPCATIISGDFSVPLWGSGQFRLNTALKRSLLPLWRANYPASFPLWGRERIYFRGPIKAVEGKVIATTEAKRASTHLPLLVTVETCDTRDILKVKKEARVTAKQPNPACG